MPDDTVSPTFKSYLHGFADIETKKMQLGKVSYYLLINKKKKKKSGFTMTMLKDVKNICGVCIHFTTN